MKFKHDQGIFLIITMVCIMIFSGISALLVRSTLEHNNILIEYSDNKELDLAANLANQIIEEKINGILGGIPTDRVAFVDIDPQASITRLVNTYRSFVKDEIDAFFRTPENKDLIQSITIQGRYRFHLLNATRKELEKNKIYYNTRIISTVINNENPPKSLEKAVFITPSRTCPAPKIYIHNNGVNDNYLRPTSATGNLSGMPGISGLPGSFNTFTSQSYSNYGIKALLPSELPSGNSLEIGDLYCSCDLNGSNNFRTTSAGNCVPRVCPDGYYETDTGCKKCSTKKCKRCPNDRCEICMPDFVLDQDKYVGQCICDVGYYNEPTDSCDACTNKNCKRCPDGIDTSGLYCYVCGDGFIKRKVCDLAQCSHASDEYLCRCDDTKAIVPVNNKVNACVGCPEGYATSGGVPATSRKFISAFSVNYSKTRVPDTWQDNTCYPCNPYYCDGVVERGCESGTLRCECNGGGIDWVIIIKFPNLTKPARYRSDKDGCEWTDQYWARRCNQICKAILPPEHEPWGLRGGVRGTITGKMGGCVPDLKITQGTEYYTFSPYSTISELTGTQKGWKVWWPQGAFHHPNNVEIRKHPEMVARAAFQGAFGTNRVLILPITYVIDKLRTIDNGKVMAALYFDSSLKATTCEPGKAPGEGIPGSYNTRGTITRYKFSVSNFSVLDKLAYSNNWSRPEALCYDCAPYTCDGAVERGCAEDTFGCQCATGDPRFKYVLINNLGGKESLGCEWLNECWNQIPNQPSKRRCNHICFHMKDNSGRRMKMNGWAIGCLPKQGSKELESMYPNAIWRVINYDDIKKLNPTKDDIEFKYIFQ